MATELAIQIVNYKTKRFLPSLLGSVLDDLADSRLSFEITILDNASGDDLSNISAEYGAYGVRVYTAEQNGGFGAGHNTLASKTKARYLLLLNPDLIFIEKQTIQRLIQTLEDTNASAVGPRLLTPISRNTADLAHISRRELKQQVWDHNRVHWGYKKTNVLSEVLWVSGAALLIRREDFMAVSGFDEHYFLYYEDVDLCRRLRQQSKKIVYNPEVCVLHYSQGAASHNKIHLLRAFFYYNLRHFNQ